MKIGKFKFNNIHCWYYPVVLGIYFLAMFFPDVVRPGVASAVFVILVAAETVFAAINGRGNLGLHNSESAHKTAFIRGSASLHNIADNYPPEDIMAFVWIAYNLLSGIWCLSFGAPLSVFLGELFTTALPMCFYFCGRRETYPDRFSKLFLISVAFTGLVGIVLFITGPKFYIDYLMRLELISKADVQTMRVRMHSVIGSTLMGYLPSVGMLLSVRRFRESMGTVLVDFQELESTRTVPVDSICSFFFMLFLAFMSNQRSAMAAAIFIIIYLNCLVFLVFEKADKKYLALEGVLAVIFTAGFFMVFRGAFMKVYYRLVSLPGSIAQRSDQWVGAANNMKSIWLGNGLGANGHRAIGYTEHLIADGGLAKLYVESGIVGTSIFIFLMILLLKKGFANIKKCAPETGVILITLIMSIGSNMMSFALSVPVFYYCMGRISGIVNEKERISGIVNEKGRISGIVNEKEERAGEGK